MEDENFNFKNKNKENLEIPRLNGFSLYRKWEMAK